MTRDNQNTDELDESAVDGFRADGVTWVDDDGRVYERTMEDGEIKDTPIGCE